MPGRRTGESGDSYLNVRREGLQVVVEVNEVIRGTLLAPQNRSLQPRAKEALGVELATAKTHLVRGLARLRDLMEEHR